MYRFFFLLLLFFTGLAPRLRATEVPEHLHYCGMDLTLDEGARTYIQEVIYKLRSNPARFQLLVDRADTWMPFVEEAFELTGLPEDLKYIVLQESALQGDAVSTSNAVGFWQFKEPTALEVGLIVDHRIDERKHIFRSSVAAAKYFHRLNQTFDNWIFSITGYNQGPTGCLPYVDPQYFGKDEMPVTLKVHWYALKAIAHKLAFEEYVGKNPQPKIWLEPRSSSGITSIDKLCILSSVSKDELMSYNLWIRDTELPTNRYFTYYVPHYNENIFASQSDPLKDLSLERNNPMEPVPVSEEKPPVISRPAAEEMKTNPETARPSGKFEVRLIHDDPDYDYEFIVLKPGISLVEEAVRHDVRAFRLMEWNDISPEQAVLPGTLIRLVPPKKAKYHIVKKGETLGDVAQEYGIDERKLSMFNRSSEFGEMLYEGQKLYLKKKKPEGEKIILLEAEKKKKPEPKVEVKKPEPKPEVKPPPPPPVPDYKLPEYDVQEVSHTVAPGETLWSISKLYGTTVDLIKLMNKLPNNSLYPGMKLKVLKQVPKQN